MSSLGGALARPSEDTDHWEISLLIVSSYVVLLEPYRAAPPNMCLNDDVLVVSFCCRRVREW